VRSASVYAAAALVLGVLVLGGWRVSTKEARHEEQLRAYWMIEDLHNARELLRQCLLAERLPMKDGALDLYHFVQTGEIDSQGFKVFRSNRRGVGPTDDEIRRGDYTSFPWERYRGDRTDVGLPVFPLMWEPQPIRGLTLVGFSDGSVLMLEAKELEKWGLGR
jgi:hypothetical protein